MKLPTLKVNANLGLEEFIDFWSKLYFYQLEDKYNEHIDIPIFDNKDIQELYIWKNGMTLSKPKQKSFNNNILSKLDIINGMKKSESFELKCFFDEFKTVSAVWKIFLLHVIKPKEFPIYDQHIHRAYNYIHKIEYKFISASTLSDKKKVDFYLNIYLKFTNENRNINLKRLDEAFFTFGKFLRTERYAEILDV